MRRLDLFSVRQVRPNASRQDEVGWQAGCQVETVRRVAGTAGKGVEAGEQVQLEAC